MRRYLSSLLAALCLTLAVIPAVKAADEWCSDDPPVQLTTLSGRPAVVFVTDSGHLPVTAKQDGAIRKAVASAQIQSGRNPLPGLHRSVSGAEFTIYVSVRNASRGA